MAAEKLRAGGSLASVPLVLISGVAEDAKAGYL
jgi:hypothetical protein